jgi:hypothetical protein
MEGRYEEIAKYRLQMKEDTKKAWRAAGRQWESDELNEVAWREAERAFPPLDSGQKPVTDSQSKPALCDHVTGLSEIPPSWGELPANASLQAEIGWCQANRLRIVEEESSGATVVHLDRAREPAPSWAALGWLETSIRAYSKYCEIAAKAAGSVEDDREQTRRERLKIEDVRQLLAEMLE